ncbi:bifunctional enoyl-CoA hydratase/phosphate acetyltransferase [Salisediminibacterium selenitireducens]|uniref:Phosphate butyryltransferase n=1 Tax=Bacillus selenitireducens (strain ATCC 700615 / DSM 15326 / MLS10) TaxID=439292 RepID=D6XVM3_BACIE|nr:bifunctional enoyl-CoA hydratase/phosphate acetyltransferase [Salisediminibacterium selenitireducens]ADH99761.1 Phosphate butyryltransferase [[Bacillus] selenitireducens MLS10]
MTIDELLKAMPVTVRKMEIAVVNAVDPAIFKMAETALEKSLCTFHFFGPDKVMRNAMKEASFSFSEDDRVTFSDASDEVDASRKAVRQVSEKKAQVLMKGMVPTSVLLKAVLHKTEGLRTGKVLSHLAGFHLPAYHKMLFLSDSAMNIAPGLDEKKQIIENATGAIRSMGISHPKVAVVAAVETVNPAMQATTDAALLTQMNRRGQITDCIVEGPLGFDNAVNQSAADSKGISSPVAGDADLIVVPTIEVGNILYKSFTYFGNAIVGGMLVGAKAPIVLTSRTDSIESKLFSLVMAIRSAESN